MSGNNSIWKINKSYAEEIPAGNILIISENSDVRRLIKNYFPEEHTIITSENDKEAILILEIDFLPDIIIIDHITPDTDWLNFLDRFRNRMGLKDIPVIVLTGIPDHETRTMFMNAGATVCLHKPVSLARLGSVVDSYLRKQTGSER